MMFGRFHDAPKAKEPAVVNAEKYMAGIVSGNLAGTFAVLDPRVAMSAPMGIFTGRPHVKAWFMFDQQVIAKAPGLKIDFNPDRDVQHDANDGGEKTKKVILTWRLASLKFTETIVLNPILLVQKIKRTMERLRPKDAAEAQLVNELLLAWTGPYFSKFCQKKRVGGIDNRAVSLPILDFSHCELTSERQLMNAEPRDGRQVIETSVAWHYLELLGQKEREEAAKAEAEARASASSGGGLNGEKKDEITIRAKNREGEQAAIIIDRNSLGKKKEVVEEELFEDQEVAVKEDRVRYVCSGLKLNNNKLRIVKELDTVLKLTVLNAFHFLTWVDLSSNKLEEIPDLSQFPIIVLYLHDNRIANPKQVQCLQHLSQLQSLTLFGNPIQETAATPKDYKFRALSAIKGPWRDAAQMTLKSFDHSVISPLDKQAVDQYGRVFGGSGSRPASRASGRASSPPTRR